MRRPERYFHEIMEYRNLPSDYTIYSKRETIYRNYKAMNKHGMVDFSDQDPSKVINDAIIALSNGGKVTLMGERFILPRPIDILEHWITLEGMGGGTWLELDDDVNDNVINMGSNTVMAQKTQIKNLQINGYKIFQTAGTGIKVFPGSSGIIKNCWIRDMKDHGIHLYWNNPIEVTQCLIESCDGTGIYLDDSVYHSHIIDNRIYYCDIGMHLRFGIDFTIIEQNHILGHSKHCMLLDNSYYNTIRGNHISDADTEGAGIYDNIHLDHSCENLFTGNYLITNNLDGDPRYGIYLDNISNNNYFYNNYLHDYRVASVLDEGSNFFYNNPGYNYADTEILAVGVSPFTHTAGNRPETIYIKGGTVTNITKDGRSIFTNTDKTIDLDPFRTIVTTYAVVPTMEICYR